jgi:membrane-associated phospholipid phosphatase
MNARSCFFAFSLLLQAVISAQPALNPAEPGAGNWKTHVLASGAQFRLPPPPDADATRAELQYLKDLRTTADDTTWRQVAYWDQGSPGYHWVQWLQQRIASAGVNTPNATRQMALLNVAIYDATIAAWDSKYAHKRPLPSQLDPAFTTAVSPVNAPSYPNDFATTAGAAAAVLGFLYPADSAVLQALAEEAARSRLFAGVSYPSDYFAGLELGKQVAAQVMDRARNDNSSAVFGGTIPTGPGFWRGTNPVCPMCGAWKPWVLTNGNQFRPDPPPAHDSAEKLADLAAMKSLPRTFADQASAFYWQTPNGIVLDWYNQIHLAILEDRLHLNPPRAARVYAWMSVAHFDSMIACWDGKYAYWAIRPVQLDPGLNTLFGTPNHPSYPAAHATNSVAIAEMMAYFFPSRASNFLAQAAEAGQSRRVAGIHYQSDIDAGNALGRKVAQLAIERARNDGSQ